MEFLETTSTFRRYSRAISLPMVETSWDTIPLGDFPFEKFSQIVWVWLKLRVTIQLGDFPFEKFSQIVWVSMLLIHLQLIIHIYIKLVFK
jgi:hypothetical protein